MQACFPDTIWNGVTGSREQRFINRAPDYHDWDRIVTELIAMQGYILGNISTTSTLVKTAVFYGPLSVSSPATNNFIFPFTTTLVKLFVHANDVPSGSDLILEVTKNGDSVCTITLPIGESDALSDQSIEFSEGDILGINVTQVDSASDVVFVLRFSYA